MMSKRNDNNFSVIIGLVSIIIICLVIIWSVSWLISGTRSFLGRLSSMDAGLLAVAVSIVGIVLNTIMTLVIKVLDYKHRIKLEARSKMIAPYEKFMATFVNAFHIKKDIDEDELAQKMNEISRDLLLYGSNDVIQKWNRIKESSLELSKTSEKPNRKNTFILWADLIYAIRKDLGLKKKITMREDDVLSVFINDVKDMK